MVVEFMKYPKIKSYKDPDNIGMLHDGDEVFIEEKFDGGNFRFMVYNRKLIFGSRECQLTSDEGEDANIGKQFLRCVQYIRDTFRMELVQANYIFYGENCTKHSMAYDWEKVPPFLGFDIYDLNTKRFLSSKRELFKYFNLIPIKLIKSGIYGKDITEQDLVIPQSEYVNAPAEGIVIKNYTQQKFGKLVSAKFKEVNRDTFGMSKKFAKDDSERVVAIYCTNARIDKCIFKLIDDGVKLEMPMMHKLPHKVIDDMYEENWKEILASNYKLDLKFIRTKVSNRCLHVLKQIIDTNMINEKYKSVN